MRSVWLALVLLLVAYVLDTGRVYPVLWALRIEPADFYNAIKFVALAFVVLGVLDESMRFPR
ncbi:hypothetical protein OR16_34728 [Cupriavidus basilensis OR16]|uniref:Uncharacterized protein n=1 Tax=Cupriavidus basilensis OR16 TaxID=1127483 RepID=H1SF44_9BURK|nr:hypothetical protein [Cupriavidus basilensis]EHP38869.1 hypothetical protein OR16_34728 [Cupriavidus basilensis OR16]